MARPLILKILGDASSGVKAVEQQRLALKALNTTTTETAVATKRAVDIQIAAATKRDARLREEIVLYREAAAAAVQGSKEQIAATNLAIRAEERLARSLGVSAHEAKKLAVAQGGSNRELGKGFRGALAGSGAFRALGRSIAFASGGFLIFATVANELRKSFDAARDAAVTQKQLAAQFKASDQNLVLYQEQIDKTTQSVSRLAGFEDDELIRVFTVAFRQTQNVSTALKIQAAAATTARGAHKDLALVGLALTKAYGGQTTALRRLGILVPGHTKGMQILNYVMARFAGQARAGTTAQDQFHAALFRTEETVGKVLTPSINRLTLRLADWLGKSKNQVMIQQQLKQIVDGISTAISALSGAFGLVTKALGGWKNAIVELAAVWAAFKAKAVADSIIISAANIRAAGITASAWRAALIATGWGALAVAAGLAAGYVITHWTKVKVWFEKFWIDLKVGGLRAAMAIVEPFSHLPGKLGGWARDAKDAMAKSMEGLGEEFRKIGMKSAKALTDGWKVLIPGPALGGGGGGTGKPGFKARFADLELLLAQAQLTATKRDDKRWLAAEAALLRERIKTLGTSRKTLADRTSLTNQLVGIEGQITAIEKDGAKKQTDERTKQLRIQERHAREELAANKKLASSLEKRIKNITSAFKTAVENTLGRFGAVGQGPILNPSQSATAGILGVTQPGGSTLAADIRAQTKQALQQTKNVNKVLAQVQGTKGPSPRAKGQRALKAQIAADLYGMSPEDVAALVGTRGGIHAFIQAEAARRKAAVAIARVEMRAQLVTLHATRIRLGNVRERIAAETQVINHIKIEIDGRSIRPRRTTTTTTTRRGKNAGVKN